MAIFKHRNIRIDINTNWWLQMSVLNATLLDAWGSLQQLFADYSGDSKCQLVALKD